MHVLRTMDFLYDSHLACLKTEYWGEISWLNFSLVVVLKWHVSMVMSEKMCMDVDVGPWLINRKPHLKKIMFSFLTFLCVLLISLRGLDRKHSRDIAITCNSDLKRSNFDKSNGTIYYPIRTERADQSDKKRETLFKN